MNMALKERPAVICDRIAMFDVEAVFLWCVGGGKARLAVEPDLDPLLDRPQRKLVETPFNTGMVRQEDRPLPLPDAVCSRGDVGGDRRARAEQQHMADLRIDGHRSDEGVQREDACPRRRSGFRGARRTMCMTLAMTRRRPADAPRIGPCRTLQIISKSVDNERRPPSPRSLGEPGTAISIADQVTPFPHLVASVIPHATSGAPRDYGIAAGA